MIGEDVTGFRLLCSKRDRVGDRDEIYLCLSVKTKTFMFKERVGDRDKRKISVYDSYVQRDRVRNIS